MATKSTVSQTTKPSTKSTATKAPTTPWKPPVMKDYTKTTDAQGNPWRVDFTEPMTVIDAERIAFAMHAQQKDKAGEQYHHHLSAVRMGVQVLGGSAEEQIAALFHDAVEDHHTTLEHLKEIGCTEHTCTLVEAVSKRNGEEQSQYLNRIVAAGHGACRVKVADLMHNTRHDRMEALKSKPGGEFTVVRLLKKYRPALAHLMTHLGLLITEEGQKALATKPVGTATGSFTSTWTPKPTSYGIGTLLKGDWPEGWNAPVAQYEHTMGQSTYTLANGEIRTEAHKGPKGGARTVKVFSLYTWSTNSKCEPTKGVTGQQYKDYQSTVEQARKGGKTW